MDVHPPHEPIRSIKEFLVHILAISIGLLIALGLEASVEWAHHRRLVREARENISQEIGDNQRNLARELDALPGEKKEMYAFLKLTELPGKPSAAEFESGKRTISEEAIMNEFLRELGTTLSDVYAKFPASVD